MNKLNRNISWGFLVAAGAIVTLLFLYAGFLNNLFEGGPLGEEKLRARHLRLHKEALIALGQTCTNEIVGLRSIIKQSLEDYEEDPKRWTGTALVEFFNRQGGVERRELQFKFGTHPDGFGNPKVFCVFDDHGLQ